MMWRLHRNESATVKYLRNVLKPGDVFIDIGAHVGYFAEYAGRLVGRTGLVFAFEPFPYNYELLSRNCRHMRQIKTIQAAVSNSSGQTFLFEHKTSSSSHSLSDLSGSGKIVPVNKISLDEFFLKSEVDRIDVVLVDVEGHERSVLQGMRKIIENHSNIIIILEYCPSHFTTDEALRDLIKEIHNLKLWVTIGLGQRKEYPISAYASVEELYAQLSAILDQEMNIESCDYINIVTQRRS